MPIRRLLFLAILLCSSCSQLTLFQDAKTLGKGNASIGAYGSIYTAGADSFDSTYPIPTVAVHGSYGVAKKLDLQLSISSLTSIMFSPKLQLYGDKESRTAFAFNPAFELLATDEGEANGSLLFNVHYSSIYSVQLRETSAFFFEPKYVRRYRDIETNEDLYGLTVGGVFSNKKQLNLGLGLSFFRQNHIDAFIIQAGFGITYKILKDK